MPRGRVPTGEAALSNTERQARYRARRKQAASVVIVRRKSADRRPRPQRWHDAVAELSTLQEAYAAWLQALPLSLRDTATAEALQATADLDLEELRTIEPPRGYGRD